MTLVVVFLGLYLSHIWTKWVTELEFSKVKRSMSSILRAKALEIDRVETVFSKAYSAAFYLQVCFT